MLVRQPLPTRVLLQSTSDVQPAADQRLGRTAHGISMDEEEAILARHTDAMLELPWPQVALVALAGRENRKGSAPGSEAAPAS